MLLEFKNLTIRNATVNDAYLLAKWWNDGKVMEHAGWPLGIGQTAEEIDEKIKNLPNTTPDLLDIYEMFLECKNKGCKFVVMEVSSHSLSLGRINGIKFDIAGFTNLTFSPTISPIVLFSKG